MAENTNIAWATHTWNPWIGCSKVATGCANCYAEHLMDHRFGIVSWGPHSTRVKTSVTTWRDPVRWNKHAAAGRCPECKGRGHCGKLSPDKQSHYACDTCGGAGKVKPYRNRVFPSLCDPFEKWDSLIVDRNGARLWICEESLEIAPLGEFKEPMRRPRYLTMDHLRGKMFDLIEQTPNLDWLLLTKRPQNITSMWPRCRACGYSLEDASWHNDHNLCTGTDGGFYRSNVWLICSASNASEVDAITQQLIACRPLVPVLGLSLEPLLGPINLSKWLEIATKVDTGEIVSSGWKPAIDWVIIGGESGENHRPMEIEWVRDIVTQCNLAGVPCFVKQDCGVMAGRQGRIPDALWAIKEFPIRGGATDD